MRKKSTKTDEPSKASLREMPEIDLSKYRILGRGRHVERARRSIEVMTLDKKMVTTLGGPDAVQEILRALANAIERTKHRAA